MTARSLALLVTTLAVLGGIGAAWWWMSGSPEAVAEQSEPTPAPTPTRRTRPRTPAERIRALKPAGEVQGGGLQRRVDPTTARRDPGADEALPAAPLGDWTVDDGAPEADEPDETSGIFPRTPEGIDGAVKERMDTILACYQTTLHLDEAVEGRMVLAFSIPPSGLDPVVDVAESSLDAVALEGCVATVFEELAFEAGDGALEVNYPVVFATGD